jgi:polysaccharide biosynthesis/export protein
MRPSVSLALLALALFSLDRPLRAQTQTRVSPMEDAGKENLPSQKLGIDDLVAVSVYDAPELTRTVRVEMDGTIWLPLLTRGVAAAGLLPRELEAAIADALKTQEILVDPVVKLTVVEYHSRPISVMGAVKKPLTFQAVGTVTILDALARAEGLDQNAGTEILLSRPQPAAGTSGEAGAPLVERIPVERLMKDADPAVNYALHGGEEIRIPEAGRIFVLGNVHKPGAFPVRDTGGSSVLKLLALSEGLTQFASKQAYVYRRDGSGTKQETPVPLDKIMQRKAEDFTLEAGDILYIPDNKGRRATMTALERMANFGSSTASGILIWH